LDRVNTILGLPLLDDRSPDETIGRDNPPTAGSSDGSKLSIKRGAKRTPSPKEHRALDRKAREVFEHRPESLEICVNGDTRTSQTVTAEVSELYLKLNRTEDPNFIEVFSEQGFRLAYLHVTEPTLYPGLEQREHIELSDSRSLDLTLSFANDLPTVHVVYKDPVFAQDTVLEDEAEPYVLKIAEDETESPKAGDSSRPGSVVRFPIRNGSSNLIRKFSHFASLHMNPLLATALILASVSVICFVLWLRGEPSINAGAFLDRAQTQEASIGVNAQPGVIFQRVRIKTPTRTSERTLYRDIQRRRRVRERNLDADDAKLRAKLTGAGVDWNDPLSAVGYRNWHNRETVQTDSVKRAGPDRLTLTTSVSDGEVVSESLTVRESDFHTVGKTIELRDYGTVEIAELNYDVMPWGAVNQDWFEPLAGQTVSDMPAMHAAIHLPHVLSDLELDEAELAVRVTLNQLRADTGEPIQLTRKTDGIDIKGVVDTDTRKQELVSHLALLPHVDPSILSAEEIGTLPPSGPPLGSEQPIQVHSIEGQASSLEQYLRDRRLSTDQVASISHSLLDGGLRMQQADVHFSELQPHFKGANQLPTELQSQLTVLSRTYLDTIENGLDANNRILRSLGLGNDSQTAALPESSSPDEDMAVQIRHYQELCQELIANGTAQSRPATVIANELMNVSARIRLHLAQMSAAISKAQD